MSSAKKDVEAAVSSNPMPASRPKLHIDLVTPRNLNRVEDQKMHIANENNNSDDHMMHAETVPLVPMSRDVTSHTEEPSAPPAPPPRGKEPPLAESEADDIDTPAINHGFSGHSQFLNHEDAEKQHADTDDVDSAGHIGKDEETRSNGTARALDEEDDPHGVHYGIESRIGERPMSAMELEQQRIIPDVNVYQQKKNLAQGMMDLALLSANANQLRYVIESASDHPYYWPSIIFISLSIIFQVLVGIGLIMNSTYNVKNEDDICKADKINNFTVIGIFLVTIINVFISAFSVAQRPMITGQ